VEEAIKKDKWKECKRSLFPLKPTERYLLVLGIYGQLGLTPQELYSVRKIWLQAPDETFNLTVKTVWANLDKLVKAGLAKSANERLTYRYFDEGEKSVDFFLRWSRRSAGGKL
jgi:Fe2+ or Zn2+ uptake regulation protein